MCLLNELLNELDFSKRRFCISSKIVKSKCKHYSATLSSGDRHAFREVCRKNKKGDDPCVKGKTCKFCDLLAKAAMEKKTDFVDDSILDEDDPPKGIQSKNFASIESNSSNNAMQHRLSMLWLCTLSH